MSLQARMSEGDRRLYNPSRDVAHNFKEVMNIVAGRLEDQKWPELVEILKREQVSMDDVGEACGCYCTYLASAANPDMVGVSMSESLKLSGFFECKPAAQVAVLAMIGTCYAGIQFGGIREASIGGEGPLETIAEVAGHAARLHRYMGMPYWQRRLADFKRRLVNTCKVIKGE